MILSVNPSIEVALSERRSPGLSANTLGQDYKEKHKTTVKRTVLNNTKLRHF